MTSLWSGQHDSEHCPRVRIVTMLVTMLTEWQTIMLATPQGGHICFIIPDNPPPQIHEKFKLRKCTLTLGAIPEQQVTMLGCHTCFIIQNCIPPSLSLPPTPHHGNMAPSLPSFVKRCLNDMNHKKSMFFFYY